METTLSHEHQEIVSHAARVLEGAGLEFILIVSSGPGRGSDIFSNLPTTADIQRVFVAAAALGDLGERQVKPH